MACNDSLKTKAIHLGKKYQQNYYELLPDWFEYDSANYEYIRHQIGYAIFGHSQINESEKDPTTCTVPNSKCDIPDRIYDKNSCKIVDQIYQQIINHGRKEPQSSIYLGIIYNVILLHQKLQKRSKETHSKPNEEIGELSATPVFKIKRHENNVWYIDNKGRIYTSWKDYLTNNTLPKCTMILPKNGIYQCDPHSKVNKYSSTVWLETLNSPACAIKNSILSALDIAANTVAVGAGIGVGVATLVTPVGPALLTAGLIANGITSTWSIARNSQKLVDFSKHKQSISPINKNAFPAWLGVGSSVLAMGASGGTMLLSKAAKATAQGNNVSTAVKVAKNSLIVSNLTVHGIGAVYDGYCLIEKYQEEKKIDLTDVTTFISHALFFGNVLINTTLATELIRTWKGTIFEKFKANLRLNRLTEEFRKVGKLKQNGSGGIVYQLKKALNTEEFLKNFKRIDVKYEGAKVIVNNMQLLDPMVVMGHLLTAGMVKFNLIEKDVQKDTQGAEDTHVKLKRVLMQLLQNFYLAHASSEPSFEVNNYEELLAEIKYMPNAKDVLIKIFKISTIVISRCNNPDQFLNEIIQFLWTYCKITLKEHVANLHNKIKNCGSSYIYHLMTNIVTCIYDYIDSIGDDLFAAFYTYMSNRDRAQTITY